MAEVRLTPAAYVEFVEALAWYEARSEKVAGRFIAAFNTAIARVSENPESYPLCDDQHRFFKLRRYPYTLIYRIRGVDVQVIAVAHAHRAPGYWQGRS